jgi:hypothetical protein
MDKINMCKKIMENKEKEMIRRKGKMKSRMK